LVLGVDLGAEILKFRFKRMNFFKNRFARLRQRQRRQSFRRCLYDARGGGRCGPLSGSFFRLFLRPRGRRATFV
jgi:hypothetical protein